MDERKINPTTIGFFTITTLALVVSAIIFLGSGNLFSKKDHFILFFDSSVNGLEQGSAVKFKGVTIGEVQEIMIRYNQPEASFHIPVIVEIDLDRLSAQTSRDLQLGDDEALFERIQAGLRGRLQVQSYLTGRLFIELDYYPESPAHLIQLTPKLKEIPTIPSDQSKLWKNLEAALEKIGNIPFDTIGEHLDSVLTRLDDGIQHIDFKALNDNLLAASHAIDTVLNSEDVRTGIKNFSSAMGNLSTLAEDTRPEIKDTLAKAQQAMDSLRKTFDGAGSALQPNTNLRHEIDAMIREFTRAARSIRVFSDYLERNPNALLTGKAPPVH